MHCVAVRFKAFSLTWLSSMRDKRTPKDVCGEAKVIAWFVVIFGINTTNDISKLLYVISEIWDNFEIILKYHEWYLCQIWRTNHAIICWYYYPQRFVNFTSRYFKLSWNTTALSQSNCRNFSCSSIMFGTPTLSTLIVLEQWPQWRFVKTFPTVCPCWRNLHKTRIVFTNFKIILIFWMYKELIFNY